MRVSPFLSFRTRDKSEAQNTHTKELEEDFSRGIYALEQTGEEVAHERQSESASFCVINYILFSSRSNN